MEDLRCTYNILILIIIRKKNAQEELLLLLYVIIAAHETKNWEVRQGVLVHEPYVAEQEEDTKLNLCVKNEVDINIAGSECISRCGRCFGGWW